MGDNLAPLLPGTPNLMMGVLTEQAQTRPPAIMEIAHLPIALERVKGIEPSS